MADLGVIPEIERDRATVVEIGLDYLCSAKGRLAFQKVKFKRYRQKLTAEVAELIRAEYRPRTRGAGARSLGERHGVSAQTVTAIINREIWK